MGHRVGGSVHNVIAAIPSPSFNTIGPFSIYGLCIALGVIAAVSLSQRRWTEVGGGEDDISAIAIWAVPAGVVGARIYHVITDWHRFEDESFWQIFNVRAGGLGIPGGMFLGVVAGMIVARARGISFPSVLDAIVPALPLAQAIGRWGNWFNQEVYGRPTDLPWGLEIDAAHRTGIPTEYQNMAENPTFHPTFLYESLWNLGLVGVIIWIDGKKIVPRGRLISVYMFGYGIARLWLETVRIDAATELAGVRVNIWMSIALIVGAGIVWFWPKKGDTSDDAVESDVLVE
ncbi:MAG: prolipoprotein diacylglyceryl transferase [Acidimicrobiales bacterium]|nr:MAG: prolipoprotein diacylglyceryl transferase [Acidimicrobiales bacterium]